MMDNNNNYNALYDNIHYKDSNNIRNTLKIVEELAAGNYKQELIFLKKLVHAIVLDPNFNISSGRVWEINNDCTSYVLKYQTGNKRKLKPNFTININDYIELKELVKTKIFINEESNELLRSKGIKLFSTTGVGEYIKAPNNKKYFKYLLSFNADNIPIEFNETLAIIGNVASLTLRNIKNNEKEYKINKELSAAGEIQHQILPPSAISFCDFDVYGICHNASSVGGDYFDYFQNTNDEENSLGIVVFDAASKGLTASIEAFYVSGAIRMANYFRPRMSTLLYRLNNLIFNYFPYDRFVTLFYIELTSSQNRLALYSNAGHCPAIHFKENGHIDFLKATNSFLGLSINQKFNVESITIKKGDRIIIYSDGITEAQNAEGEQYGVNRLVQLIKNNKHLNSKELVMSIINNIEIFTNGAKYNDDKTVVVITRNY